MDRPKKFRRTPNELTAKTSMKSNLNIEMKKKTASIPLQLLSVNFATTLEGSPAQELEECNKIFENNDDIMFANETIMMRFLIRYVL